MTVEDLPGWLAQRNVDVDSPTLEGSICAWYRARYPWMHEHSVRTKAARLTRYFRREGKIQ